MSAPYVPTALPAEAFPRVEPRRVGVLSGVAARLPNNSTRVRDHHPVRCLRWRSTPRQAVDLAGIRNEAHTRAQHATATAYIFERRAIRLGRRLDLLTFVGVAVPLVVGAVVLAYGADFGPLRLLVPIALAIAGVQLIVFVWSVVTHWVGRYDHAVRAVVTNKSLVAGYEAIGKRAEATAAESRHELEVLKAIDAKQEESDYRQGVTEAEKRMGMHALLRQYQKVCVECDRVPTDMKPLKCGICGDYPARWVKR